MRGKTSISFRGPPEPYGRASLGAFKARLSRKIQKMNYLNKSIENTNQVKSYEFLEISRARILGFGYSWIVYKSGLRKSFRIQRKLLISSHN